MNCGCVSAITHILIFDSVSYVCYQGGTSMESKVKRSRRGIIERKLCLSSTRKLVNERLVNAIEKASLKYVPIEERRRQASKPLYLIRYE